MHGTLGHSVSEIGRVIRRNNDWTLKEHEVVVTFWPDIAEIMRRLPHRTKPAIQTFAGKCNLRKAIHSWTQPQHNLLRKRVNEGVARIEIARELGLTKLQITNRMRQVGLTYPRRPPGPTGNALIDCVRKRAFDLNISLCELDEACRSGRQFEKSASCRRIHIKHIVTATKVLDGEITIRWRDE